MYSLYSYFPNQQNANIWTRLTDNQWHPTSYFINDFIEDSSIYNLDINRMNNADYPVKLSNTKISIEQNERLKSTYLH